MQDTPKINFLPVRSIGRDIVNSKGMVIATVWQPDTGANIVNHPRAVEYAALIAIAINDKYWGKK